ncbi:fibronectin type III domain-containing protein [Candidatus Woesearchaeota archaeon]|nr:fibronectin type III domain-containing protein [Candidatus Woesearchaeota archaeon]
MNKFFYLSFLAIVALSYTAFAQELVGYQDSFVNGFTFNEWQNPSGTKCMVSSSYTAQAASGTASLASNLNQWCTLFLYRSPKFNINNYSHVEFDIYGISPPLGTFGIRIADNAWSSVGNTVSIGNYVTVTDSWQHVAIPLSVFGVAPGTMIAGLQFRDLASSSGKGYVLFDNYKFSQGGADFTPPVRSNGQPSGSFPPYTTDVTISLNTDENATCRYSDAAGTNYAAMSGLFGTTGQLSHSELLTGLGAGAVSKYVRCSDSEGNANNDDFVISFTIEAPDLTAPVISNGQPSGSLLAGTTQVTMSIDTDEAADCKYSDVSGTAFDLMPNVYGATGSTSHSTLLTGLSNGSDYIFYSRCEDAAGNANSNDFIVSFSVAEPDLVPPLRANGFPSGTFPPGTAAVNIGLATDEVASCRYSEAAGTGYYQMASLLGTADGLSHSGSYSSLTDGQSVNLYARCIDLSNNTNQDDFGINFSIGIDTTPPSISSLSVTPGIESAEISWSTNESSTSQVEYGLTSSLGSFTALDPALVVSHSVELSGLSPDTTYYYRVISNDGSSNQASAPATPGTFATLPQPEVLAELSIYEDSFLNSFKYNEWDSGGHDCLITLAYTAEAASGAVSMETNLNDYCTLFLWRSQTFNISNYTHVEFDIFGYPPSQNSFNLYLVPNGWNVVGTSVQINDYTTVTDSWSHVRIPLADFMVAPGAMIAGFRFRDSTNANNYGSVLLDNIRFVKLPEQPNLCENVVCADNQVVCEDGYVASCSNSCIERSGSCTNCVASVACIGHYLSTPTNVVIMQVDDFSNGYLNDIAIELTELHITKGVPITVAVIAQGLESGLGNYNGLTEHLRRWDAQNNDSVAIALHTFNHQSYSGWNLSQMVEDIQKGLDVFNLVGLYTEAFVPAFDWAGPELPQAILDSGLKIGMDGLPNPNIESLYNPMILEDGEIYRYTFSSWDPDYLFPLIDAKLAEQNYTLVQYHHNDFTGGNYTPLIHFLDAVKAAADAGNYTLMTGEQYYDLINGE